MFVRVVKSGNYHYVRLVESYRDKVTGKVRQRLLANLFRLDSISGPTAKALKSFFDRQVKNSATPDPDFQLGVSKDFGNIVFLHEIWIQLGLDQALRAALKLTRRDEVKTEALIRLMVFCQFCAPTSKRGVLNWLEVVKIPGMKMEVTHQMLLRAMDALEDNFQAIKNEVSKMILPLVDHEFTLALYDLTTVRVCGKSEVENDLRQIGKNKETGGFARQFVYGIVQNRDGLPLMYQIHRGNTADTSTLTGAITALLEQYPVSRIIAVADRGLLSEKNIAKLPGLGAEKGKTLQHIIAVPIRRYKELRMSLDNRELVEDCIFEKTFLGHRLVVSYNAKVAREKQLQRRTLLNKIESEAKEVETHLELLQQRTKQQDEKAVKKIRSVVRKSHLSRIAKAELKNEKFTFRIDQDALTEAEQLDGLLALSTDVDDLDAQEIIDHYKSRIDIESGFKTLKGEIKIAPVRHWKPGRINSHGMICYLALLLHRVIRQRLRARGVNTSVADVMRVLAQIKQVDVSIKDKEYTAITKQTEEQLNLLDLFEVEGLKYVE